MSEKNPEKGTSELDLKKAVKILRQKQIEKRGSME